MPVTPSLAGQPKIFLENQLVLIREGLRDIPQMKGMLDGLKDAELVALASYFSAQTPVRLQLPVTSVTYQRGKDTAQNGRCQLSWPLGDNYPGRWKRGMN